GKLDYLIGWDYSEDLFNAYISQNRSIEAQALNLSESEKQKLYDYLLNNIKPENRRYHYDLFYDNCATKIREVTQITLNNNIQYSEPENFEPQTFRELIHGNLNRNSWGCFGIDVALGSVIDRKATAYEHMFLPKYIHQFFALATLKGSNEKLVKENHTLYEKIEAKETNNFFLSPLFIFGVLGLLIIYITYTDFKKQKRTVWLDVSLFTITSLVGIIILLLWFATDHTGTHHNYNLLWAFTLNVFVIGQLLRKKPRSWFIKYIKLLVILLALLTLHWTIGVQIFAIGLIPFLIALFVRYVFLIMYFSNRS